MGTVLILSDKPVLTKKEEESLANEGVQVTNSAQYSLFTEYCIKTGKLHYDVIVIDDSIKDIDPYIISHKLHSASDSVVLLIGKRFSAEMEEKREDIGYHRYYKKPIEPDKLYQDILKAVREPEVMKAAESEVKVSPIQENFTTVTSPVMASVISRDNSLVLPVNLEKSNISEAQCETELVEEKFEPAAKEAAPVEQMHVTGKGQTAPIFTKSEEGLSNLWNDARVNNLVTGILKGQITKIIPTINLGIEGGFSYPEIEKVMEASTKEVVKVLETLVKHGILIRNVVERIMVAPDGEVQLVPMELCPNCDSPNLNRGQLVEHFSCGYIGLEEEFAHGYNQICPKCHRELKLIGTDYRRPGMRYICNSCHGIFPAPTIKNRSIKTGKIYLLEELSNITIYNYEINETYRQKLEFEMEPKKQLIDYLVRLGYQIKESVQVKGRSGANHKIDILATMDDLITNHTVAIGILAAENNESEVPIEPLFNFDSRIYDTGIDGKMVIAVPSFSAEAMKFAERQGIRVYGLADLRDLLSLKTQINQVIDAAAAPEDIIEQPAVKKPGANDFLKMFLENKGYEVEENITVTGQSGTEHTLELFAHKDDGIVNHKIAASIINKEEIEDDTNDIMLFDTKAYDAGVDVKMVVAVPELSQDAMEFAERQGIKVYSLAELKEQLTLSGIELGDEEDSEDADGQPSNGDKSNPRAWLKWILENRGYEVEEKLKVTGRSGAEHVLDMFAQKDDGIIDHKIAACVITSDDIFENDVNEVMQFDTAAYDAGIRDKILVCGPNLSKEAKQFAEYQRIKILETKELIDISTRRETESIVSSE
ncbi:MAG: restriction endonuclease [Dehalococcoidales bacterium]|nr:restriction endonuclease [Dehalococcoidales bacterium]